MGVPDKLCRDCGGPLAAQSRIGAGFCSEACRHRFNNRRKARGAELYDLFMTLRYQRGVAAKLGVWTAICRLAQQWREEDERERDGRRSWRGAATVLSERPWLRAIGKGRA